MNEETINSQICKQHSGLLARLKSMEDNVSKLWVKWDSMQKMVVGILVGLILNLGGIIFLIASNGLK